MHLLTYFTEELFYSDVFREDLLEIVSEGRGIHLVKSRVSKINKEFGPHGKTPIIQCELTVDEITSLADNVSRRHFAQALTNGHGLSREQVGLLIGNSSPAYVPSGVEIGQLRLFFEKYDVVPVLAHPAAGSYPGPSHYSEVLPPVEVVLDLLPEFVSIGLKGIEVYYPGHTSAHIEMLFKLASENSLLVTGGSDCHDSESRPIGSMGLSKPIDMFKHI